MPDQAPVVLGVAGVGRFAGAIVRSVLNQGPQANPPARLAAVCEPDTVTHAETLANLREQGIKVFESFDEMIELPELEGVWLPVPIALHRPFTEQALAAGKAVMTEKPVAGSIDDLDAMIAARDRAGLPVIVGFQDVYDPTTMPLKRKLLDGAIGKVRRATVHACWPRTMTYFTRNNWAGKLKAGDTWVLDSPAQNALAHYINIALFLMGPTPESSAKPIAIEAELYRAAPVETFDTISARVTVEGGAQLLILLTHACEQSTQPVVVIEGDAGKMMRNNETIELHTAQGVQTTQRDQKDVRKHEIERFTKLIRGQSIDGEAAATLEVARSHALVVNGATEAAPVHTVPANRIKVMQNDKGETLHTIPDIVAIFERCAASHKMLHESGELDFTKAPGRRDLSDYRHFAGPCEG